ncbi:large-conductance mechanosensitive channel [Runella defluvii]|uniref:Large-conductance mechanosensitive channel n=1 Tax=Runella defluvii TaxID=370973 RepID=A0A7W5ZS51_9BACT|nr:hypothetical protein [Runella defluvii]MBB3841106.1 large-conductance mechanosensitive channel [Runella defluvii]
MKNLTSLVLAFIFSLLFQQVALGQNNAVEPKSKVNKILLEREIERTLMNGEISRDDIQYCFELMQAYSDLSYQSPSLPAKIQETQTDQKWIDWVDFNTGMAVFLVIFLILKGIEYVEKMARKKRTNCSFEDTTYEALDCLLEEVREIRDNLDELKTHKSQE